MTSDSRGRLETLHSSSLFSKSFVSSYTDVLLIDGTHKTNIHDLSLIVTTVVDSLGKSVPIIFLLAPSEYSDSIIRHITLLKLALPDCCDNSSIRSRSIMTDEGSSLVKLASDMDIYHYCLCAFNIN